MYTYTIFADLYLLFINSVNEAVFISTRFKPMWVRSRPDDFHYPQWNTRELSFIIPQMSLVDRNNIVVNRSTGVVYRNTTLGRSLYRSQTVCMNTLVWNSVVVLCIFLQDKRTRFITVFAYWWNKEVFLQVWIPTYQLCFC